VSLLFHEDSRIPPLEEMADPAVPPVEGLGIDAIELAHSPRQIRPRGLDEEVVVVRHQAVGMAAPAITPDHLGEGVQKEVPVVVVPKGRLSGVPSGGEMIDGTGIFDSKGPSHVSRVAQELSHCKT
jgi:hypothetical protein